MFSSLSSRVAAAADKAAHTAAAAAGTAAHTAAVAAGTAAHTAAAAADKAVGKVEEVRREQRQRKANEKELKMEAAKREAVVKVREFQEVMLELHGSNVSSFLSGDGSELYPRPGAAEAATGTAATARRLTPLVCKAIKAAGYGEVVVAYKIAKHGLAAVLLSPKLRVLAEHILPLLKETPAVNQMLDQILDHKRHGARETELALRLYYLGCTEAMNKLRKLGGEEAAAPADALLGGDAADSLLAHLGELLGAAQYLYAAKELPVPHNTAAWGAWYAAQLAKREGWSTIACVGPSSSDAPAVPTFPHATRFPAWLLAARNDAGSKRAVLCIRGSDSQNDWCINAQSTPAPLELGGAQHMAHGGMLRAARAILSDCACRAALDRLLADGYSLTAVGHSLGGGVAALITALLLADSVKVTCVAYASPACVEEALADLLKPHVTAVVNHEDPVPRLSVANCVQLAADIAADDPLYRARFAKDKVAYANYIKTLGKTQAMSHAADEFAEPSTVAAEANDASAQECGCDDEGSAASAARSAGPALVVPGRVIYLEGHGGAMRAYDADSRLPTLRRLVVTQHAVADHGIRRYAAALRAVSTLARAARSGGAQPSLPTPPAPFAPATCQGGNGWTPCSVCGSDVIWTAPIAGSDTARAWATHHCRACGGVVCAFCAPAADKMAGDSIGEFDRLPDHRMPLPSRGYLEPVRVCRPCAYKSCSM